MSITADIIRGHTDAIILARLLQEDSYGYRISKDILALSGGEYEFKEATLYSAFRRLEQAGAIISYWGNEDTGARRKYYSVTDKGREMYYSALAEWKSANAIIGRLLDSGTDIQETR